MSILFISFMLKPLLIRGVLLCLVRSTSLFFAQKPTPKISTISQS